jgi:hypothetical protein
MLLGLCCLQAPPTKHTDCKHRQGLFAIRQSNGSPEAYLQLLLDLYTQASMVL